MIPQPKTNDLSDPNNLLKAVMLNKFMSTGALALLLMMNLAGDHTLLAHVKHFQKNIICCHSSDTLWTFLSVRNCFKDRLPDRHSCLNLYPCVIKVQPLNQSSLSLSLPPVGFTLPDLNITPQQLITCL